MAQPNWTEQQQSAICHRQGTMLVSAAAGSGKTAVLVERALRIVLEDRIDIDRLLIVTFTNAAAAELKARLSQGLEQRLAQSAPDQRQWIRRQKMLLQRANICTADAFCLDLIRQNFFRLHLPPDIVIGQTGLLYRLRSQALEQVQEEFASDPHFSAFAGMYGKSKEDSTAERTLIELYEFFATQPDKAQLRENLLAPWLSDCPIEQTPWGGQLWQQLQQQTKQLAHLMQQLQQSDCPFGEKWTEQKWQDWLQKVQAQTDYILQASQQDWDTLRRGIKSFAMPRVVQKLQEDSPQGYLQQSIKQQIESMEQLMPCFSQEDVQDRQVAAPVIQAVLQAEERLEQLFFQLKKEQKVLEFSDVEQLALQLLWDSTQQTPTPYAKELATQFHQIMVDEYQDTNALQNRLYHCLASPQQDNLFLVGDVKQSIYRFRHAAPYLFQQKQQQYPLFNGKDFPATLALNANFRSLPAVIQGVNYFFSQLMSQQVGEVEYTQDHWLNCITQPQQQGQVLLDLVLEQEKQPYKDAWQVAHRIHKLVEQQTPIRDKDGIRPVKYQDICLLLRTKSDFDLYQRVLQQWQIPSYVDVGRDLLQAPEVQPLISLLRALDRPSDDVQMAAVLTGPIAGFGMELLVQLRLIQKKGNLYSILLNWQQQYQTNPQTESPIPPKTAQQLQQFLQQFHFWQRKSAILPGQDLCQLILQSVNWVSAIGSGALGQQRRNRLEQFLQWVQQTGQNGLPSLVSALEDAQASAQGIPELTTGVPEGCVAIMTVHRSKGLEFPVVILADTFHQFNTSDLKKPFSVHPSAGVAMQLPGISGNYNTAAMVYLRSLLRQEMLSEEMRVLYVALTRAKDLLCIVAMPPHTAKLEEKVAPLCLEIGKGISPNWVEKKNSIGDWLLAAVLLHPDGKVLREGIGVIPQPDLSSRLTISVTEASQGQPPEPQTSTQTQQDTALWQQIQQQFDWQDPFADLAKMESKVSVSQIAHKNREFGWQPSKPLFARSTTTMTGAERGTAVHRFLQMADLQRFASNPKQALEQEIQRLTQNRLMDSDSAKVLDQDKILHFFQSPLYQRMLQAMQPPCQLWREFAFISGIPAQKLAEQQGNYGDATVLVQGIADLVLIFPDHAELIDYKTDYVQTAEQLKQRYAQQLGYYKQAIQKRLQVPLTQCSLYSLHLNQEIVLQEL